MTVWCTLVTEKREHMDVLTGGYSFGHFKQGSELGVLKFMHSFNI